MADLLRHPAPGDQPNQPPRGYEAASPNGPPPAGVKASLFGEPSFSSRAADEQAAAPVARTEEDAGAPITQRSLNAALASERERQRKQTEKVLAEIKAASEATNAQLIATLTERLRPVAPVENYENERATNKERIARLEKQADEARKSAEAAEQGRVQQLVETAKNRERQVAIAALVEKIKIAPSVARAVVRDLEAEGAIKFDAEGRAIVAVARVRRQGEERSLLEHDDVNEGITDWLKTEAAKEWIPANSPSPSSTRASRTSTSPSSPGERPLPKVEPGDLNVSEDSRWGYAVRRAGLTLDGIKADILSAGPTRGTKAPRVDASEEERWANVAENAGGLDGIRADILK